MILIYLYKKFKYVLGIDLNNNFIEFLIFGMTTIPFTGN